MRGWTRWPLGAARALGCGLIAMALSGCGGGDQGGGDGASRTEALAAAGTAQADSCAPPPAAHDSLFQGAWHRLSGWVAGAGVTFPDEPGNSEMRRVQLCDSCAAARVVIRSGSATHCLKEGQLNGEPRIAGLYILQEDYPAQRGFGPFRRNDSILVFASTQDAPARLAFRRGDAVAVAPDGSWRFHYCDDAHEFRNPRAGWRDPKSGKPLPPSTGEGELGEPSGGGSYGWMACANGCCQFYTPPPGETIETPAQADTHAPNVVGRGAKHPPCTPG